MITEDRAVICAPAAATQHYETLRAHALGDISRAPEFTVLLRDGMGAWLRGLGSDSACTTPVMTPKPCTLAGDLKQQMPNSRLIAILTDAVLEGAGSAPSNGEN